VPLDVNVSHLRVLGLLINESPYDKKEVVLNTAPSDVHNTLKIPCLPEVLNDPENVEANQAVVGNWKLCNSILVVFVAEISDVEVAWCSSWDDKDE